MANNNVIERLVELLEEPVQSHGLELVAVEQTGGRKQPIIRVLLDKEGGVTLDEVAGAAKWIGVLLDESDPVPGTYTLEVSSPGIDRPLRKLEDFSRFAGEQVTVKTCAHEGRSSWTGTLTGVRDDQVCVTVDGEEVEILYSDIVKARIKGRVDFGNERETPDERRFIERCSRRTRT